MTNLDGRIAIITGGAKGIGAETARVFRGAGATVETWDVTGGADRTVDVSDVGAVTAAVHAAVALHGRIDILVNNAGIVRDAQLVKMKDGELVGAVTEAVQVAVALHGRIDILVNNAGIVRDAQLVKMKDGELVGAMEGVAWDAVLAVNLKGTFLCGQAVAPAMIRQGHGRILNASSVVGLYGNFGQSNYVATKAGVIGLTKVWARELGPKGITVNAVAPGFIGTEMVRAMPEQVLKGMIEHTPVRRMGEPLDVANAYLFLASDEASFINGAVLCVDGGLVVGT